MVDEVDVEALLEAPYRKQEASPTADAADHSPQPSDQDDEEVDRERKRHKKRHRRSRSRSKSRSHSPRRHRSRERRRHRSGSRDRRRRSRERRRSRSRSYERKRSHSRDRRRRSRERRRRSRSRSPRDRRRRSRSSSRDRKRRHSRSRSPPERKQSTSGTAGNGMPLLPPPAPRVHEAEPPPEDRDKRTVMCMQLSARVGPKQLEEFFQQIGQVRDVQMISDRNSRRSKGIAYVEFYSQETVPLAMAMSGQKLFGVPIIVQPTMAEKNRLAAAAQNLKKAEGPKKLYVGSLHYNINESMLKGIFEPFGQVEKVTIMRDPDTNMSKGFGFVEFIDSDSAERAMANLNNLEIAGRPIKVNHVTEREVMTIDSLEVDESDVGMGMTPQSRVALMAKLAEGHNAGLSVPQIQMPSVPIVSCCLMISNMFDASTESGSGWDQEIKDDVIEEINTKCGNVMHLFVDKFSAGNVYIKCQTPQVAAGAMGAFNGRYYGGNKIVAQLVPESTYHLKFPVAAAATIPLRPLP